VETAALAADDRQVAFIDWVRWNADAHVGVVLGILGDGRVGLHTGRRFSGRIVERLDGCISLCLFSPEISALSDRKARDVALLTVEVVALPVAVAGVFASRVRCFALLLANVDARTADDTRVGWQALYR
jgi:hypothetical protein